MIEQEVLDKLTIAKENFEARIDLATELQEKDPKLTLSSAVTIAGDILSKSDADMLVEKGYTFEQALPFVGSFARLDWAVTALEKGFTTAENLYKLLPSLWSGSDPDDTDIRFFNLWVDAYKYNHSKIILDDKPLPNGRILDIYRGQDENALAGIAWTLNEKIAQRFARGAATRQSNRNGIVYEAKIYSKDVIAYLTKRSEDEVIVNPLKLIVE